MAPSNRMHGKGNGRSRLRGPLFTNKTISHREAENMKRTHKWMALAALVMALFVAGTALAANGNKANKKAGKGGGPGMGMQAGIGGGMGRAMGIGMALQRLIEDPAFLSYTGISQSQADKISSVFTTSAKEAVRNKAEIDILQIDLQELLSASSPNKSQIHSKIDQIGKLQTENMKSMADVQIEIRSLLTDDQIAKAMEYLRENRGPGKGGGMGQGMGPGGMGMGPGGPGQDYTED